MKKLILLFALFLCTQYAHAQLGASIHQSSLPFAGLNYGIGERFLPELRFGIDNFIENTSVELCVQYAFVRKETVDVYTGLGGRLNLLQGIVLPAGLNIYPFENKAFGFQMELAGLFLTDAGGEVVLRGSWGIRYRFVE